MSPATSARPFIRERASGCFWYGKWSRHGQPVVRALGRAWVDPDGTGGWRRKRGRAPEGVLTEAEAAARMLALMREHDADQTLLERDAEERRRRGVTFRELAAEYLGWLEDVQGAKPSTLRDHRSLLAEPGQAYRRGSGTSRGQIMAALGDRPAREVTTREIEELLRSISSTGVAPRTVNKARQLVCAVFNYGARPSTYGLPTNPAQHADRRREPEAAALAFYSPEQIETVASALAAGAHRDPSRPALSTDELEARARARDDAQDAELIRVAAYAGLRRGELVTLRWRDVDAGGRKLIVRRALSGQTEVRSTKSRRAREVPLPDQAATALERLRQRRDFTGPDDYVFASRLGRRLDPSALRRRFERARDAAGLEPLRFHDLRHTYGSLLVAGGIDLPSVKAAMGHSHITTTERYLHARPAGELADRFTRAFAGASAVPELTHAA
ncbi:MAG: tyrosine-type recombinase/integrase [Solirubrobacteraceae bacterium]